MTPRWAFPIAILLALLSPARAAGICADLAAMIRQGAAQNDNPNGEGSAIARLAAKSGGRLRVEEGKQGKLPRRFPAGDPEDPSEDNVRLTPLGKGVVAATRVQGSMHCQTWSFFRDNGRRVRRLPNPAALGIGDDTELCWDSYADIATWRGMPVFLTEADGDNHVGLTVTPWLGKRWDAMCSIAADFAPGFQFDGRFCKEGQGRCAALQAQAMELVRRYRTDPGHLPAAAPSPLATQKDLDLPTFDMSAGNSYTRFEKRRVMAVTVNGEHLLAAVGDGSFGWRDYTGTLAAFWRMKGGTLEPVAGYQVTTYRGAAKAVTVKP